MSLLSRILQRADLELENAILRDKIFILSSKIGELLYLRAELERENTELHERERALRRLREEE